MKRIPLTQGKFALVDDADFDQLNQYKWYAKKDKNTFYAVRHIRLSTGKQKIIFMHREIMNTPEGMKTDHKDGKGWNNQRNNLRICTNQQNCRNQRKSIKKGKTSRFKGVTWDKKRQKWYASIKFEGKDIYLGRFEIEEQAAEKYFADFAKPNLIKIKN